MKASMQGIWTDFFRFFDESVFENERAQKSCYYIEKKERDDEQIYNQICSSSRPRNDSYIFKWL